MKKLKLGRSEGADYSRDKEDLFKLDIENILMGGFPTSKYDKFIDNVRDSKGHSETLTTRCHPTFKFELEGLRNELNDPRYNKDMSKFVRILIGIGAMILCKVFEEDNPRLEAKRDILRRLNYMSCKLESAELLKKTADFKQKLISEHADDINNVQSAVDNIKSLEEKLGKVFGG